MLLTPCHKTVTNTRVMPFDTLAMEASTKEPAFFKKSLNSNGIITEIVWFSMKGVILHGGFGTKLRPLTHTSTKQLIPVANKPISQYVLEDLRNYGVTDIAIIIGGVNSEKVKEHYGNVKLSTQKSATPLIKH